MTPVPRCDKRRHRNREGTDARATKNCRDGIFFAPLRPRIRTFDARRDAAVGEANEKAAERRRNRPHATSRPPPGAVRGGERPDGGRR
eukprot:CAMPEP_0172571848 /NCGR_PEP_ID=MMETSP1067-20121228/132793_1 /TAXON_ID=265564 ORGANISM="Thalassiosira punctigera, Strain Tpunct2005C2" /NCGR_SAMPLE_ID=MMETSP1067 /ASSEMBLY_ACC=CAM_ASM_000444 /LENGTH=87 /DNA_ID=CAMNT_0013364267 /DNA_START=196 /DNA_END=455 /DNA_ORIENTATION=-